VVLLVFLLVLIFNSVREMEIELICFTRDAEALKEGSCFHEELRLAARLDVNEVEVVISSDDDKR